MSIKKDLSMFYLVVVVCVFSFSCSSTINYIDPDGPKYTGKFAPAKPDYGGTIKVLSFNIKFSKKIDRAIYELTEFQNLKHADILLLQEMDHEGTKSIAKELKYNYIYYPASIHTRHKKDFGNAILSKWPMENEKKIILPHSSIRTKQKRIAISAMVKINRFEILTYSIHTEGFWLSNTNKKNQIDSIANSIPSDLEYVIVGGDFNTIGSSSNKEAEKVFIDCGFVCASKTIGSTAKIGPFKGTLDHIFTRGVQVIGSGKLEQTEASDHFPFWVVLKLEESESQ